MGWQERAAHYFPETDLDNSPDRVFRRLDNPPRASVPTVPTSTPIPKLGTLGALARYPLSGERQHDAHISLWRDWLERAAILEYSGGLNRPEANRRALRIVAGTHTTKRR